MCGNHPGSHRIQASNHRAATSPGPKHMESVPLYHPLHFFRSPVGMESRVESESRKMKSSTDLSIAVQEDLSEAIPSCLSAVQSRCQLPGPCTHVIPHTFPGKQFRSFLMELVYVSGNGTAHSLSSALPGDGDWQKKPRNLQSLFTRQTQVKYLQDARCSA